MASRTYTIHLACIPGCRESSFSESSTRKDEQEARVWYANHPWRCFRHREANEVLSVGSPEKTATLKVFDHGYGLFWGPEDGEKGDNGIKHGPGFRAIAKDFPPGTRLIVTARIEYPSEGQPDGQ